MSGRLVKVIDGKLVVARERIAAPGYTLYVSAGTSAQGWTYYADALEPADFAAPWRQPAGAHDAYALGAIVSHGGSRWRSSIVANVWEPGVSGWANADADVPAWIQPTGAHDAYGPGTMVRHADKIWRNTLVEEGSANVWEPGVSGWRETALLPPSGAVPPPAWVQPTGAHDAYQIGDRVTHAGHVWVCASANNVWEPGVYGWNQES